MSNPNRIPMIVGGVVGIVALAICLFLPKEEQSDPSLQNTDPTNGIEIQVPTDPTTHIDPTDPDKDDPIIVIPGEDETVDPTDPSAPQPGDPYVEDGEEEEEIKISPTDGEEVIPDDEVTDIGKSDDTEYVNDEIRNDAVLEEKEEAEEQLPPEEEHEVIVVEEETTVGEAKGEVHENEDESNPDGDTNKNAPEYEESPGGDNPFDNDTETIIEETPVEDLIGDGEDAPGEGTHF